MGKFSGDAVLFLIFGTLLLDQCCMLRYWWKTQMVTHLIIKMKQKTPYGDDADCHS